MKQHWKHILLVIITAFGLFFLVFGYSGLLPRLMLKYDCAELHTQLQDMERQNHSLEKVVESLSATNEQLIRALSYRIGYLSPTDKVIKFRSRSVSGEMTTSQQYAGVDSYAAQNDRLLFTRSNIIILSVILAAIAVWFLRLGPIKKKVNACSSVDKQLYPRYDNAIMKSTQRIIRLTKRIITKVAYAMQKPGQVAVMPTDTVYGLIARINDSAAINTIYAIKHRPKNKPCIILAASMADVALVADSRAVEKHRSFIDERWPGPYTFILPAARSCPIDIQKNAAVAVRIPAYPILRECIQKIGSPVIATSANISGEKICATPHEVRTHFNGIVDILIERPWRKSQKVSTIIDLTGSSPSIIREN